MTTGQRLHILIVCVLFLASCSSVQAHIPLKDGQMMDVTYSQWLRSYEVQFTQGKDGTVVTIGARSELDKLKDLITAAAAVAP